MARFLKGNMMNNQQNNNKILTFASIVLMFLGALFLIGCSGGASNSSPSTNAIINPDDISPIVKKSKVVSISRISTIPTNTTISAAPLRVDNFTDETLTLSISSVTDVPTITRVNKSANTSHASLHIHNTHHVNTHHHNKNSHVATTHATRNTQLDTTSCKTIQAGSYCILQFTPPSKEGSSAIHLSYTGGATNKSYSVSQLVEYSSTLSEQDGFLVSSDHVVSISSANSMSIAIPFVAQGDYTDLKVSSTADANVGLDCGTKVHKGQHCNALSTLPSAKYVNTVTITAKDVSGNYLTATINTQVSYEDKANLAIQSGALIISQDQLSASILIVSNGSQSATNVSDLLTTSNFLGSLGELVTKSISCDGNEFTALPHQLATGAICTITFTKPQNSMVADSNNYKVIYNSNMSAETTIYYKYRTTAKYAFTITAPSANMFSALTGVEKGDHTVGTKIIDRAITITNTGEKSISSIKGAGLASNFTLLPGNSDSCSSITHLDPGASCEYLLRYNVPNDAVNSSFIITFSANEGDTDNVVKQSADHSLSISYIVTLAVKGIIMSDVTIPELTLNNDDVQTVKLVINNPSSEEFLVTSLLSNTGTKVPGLVVSIPDTVTDGTENPLKDATISSNATNAYQIKGKNIPSGKIAEVLFTYGKLPSGSPINLSSISMTLNGVLDGRSYSKVAKVSYSGVLQQIRSEIVGVRVGDFNTMKVVAPAFTNVAPSTFELTKINSAQVQFKYTALGKDASSFSVISRVPFGFQVNKALTTCTIAGKSNGQLLDKNGCFVTYDFMSQDLAGYVFYTEATKIGGHSICAPEHFSNKDNAIHVGSYGSCVTILANKFATVTATDTVTSGAPSAPNDRIHTIIFTKTGPATSVMLNVMLNKAKFATGNNDTVTIAQSTSIACNLTSSCTLAFTVKDQSADSNNRDVILPFTYSMSPGEDFNIVYGEINLPVNITTP